MQYYISASVYTTGPSPLKAYFPSIIIELIPFTCFTLTYHPTPLTPLAITTLFSVFISLLLFGLVCSFFKEFIFLYFTYEWSHIVFVISFSFFFLVALCGMRDLIPDQGSYPIPLVVEALSINHWTTRKVLVVVQSLSRVWLCNPVACSTPGFPVFHYLRELAQIHVHWVSDAI